VRLLDRLLPGAPVPEERIINAPVNSDLIREALTRHGYFKLTARGGSMSPFMPDGASVTVVPFPLHRVKRGDIVMASYGGSWYVIHRVVRRLRDGTILTKGDSLDGLDPPIDESALLGRVVGYAARGRHVSVNRGIMKGAGPLLAVCSLGALAVGAVPAAVLVRLPAGARLARLLRRMLRAPAWVAAWCLVRASSGPAEPRSNGRDTDRSGDHSP